MPPFTRTRRRPPPPHPRDFGATRFFARIHAVDLECPRCGKVMLLRPPKRGRLRRYQPTPGHTWEPHTQRLHCHDGTGCGKVYRLGVLAWDPPRGVGAHSPAEDTVPHPRELAQLREEGAGWWMPEGSAGAGRMDMTNYAATPERPDRDEEEDPQP